jgi:hypothetical protein
MVEEILVSLRVLTFSSDIGEFDRKRMQIYRRGRSGSFGCAVD